MHPRLIPFLGAGFTKCNKEIHAYCIALHEKKMRILFLLLLGGNNVKLRVSHAAKKKKRWNGNLLYPFSVAPIM